MAAKTPGSPKPLSEISARELKAQIARDEKAIRTLPDPRSLNRKELAATRERLEMTGEQLTAARDEKARRDEVLDRDGGLLERIRRARALGPVSTAAGALRSVSAFADPELQGETLVAANLSELEGREVAALVEKRRALPAGATLDPPDRARYEAILGKAAGKERLFEDKRAKATLRAKLDEFNVAARRHPQAEDLVAAVLSDPFLFDGLAHRIRADAVELDAYGNTTKGMTGAIFSLDNVAALHLLVSLIVANGGNPIEVGEHGNVGRGLPRLPAGGLGQLSRNGYVTVTGSGSSRQVGLGARTRQIAEKWGIPLPAPLDQASNDG